MSVDGSRQIIIVRLLASPKKTLNAQLVPPFVDCAPAVVKVRAPLHTRNLNMHALRMAAANVLDAASLAEALLALRSAATAPLLLAQRATHIGNRFNAQRQAIQVG